MKHEDPSISPGHVREPYSGRFDGLHRGAIQWGWWWSGGSSRRPISVWRVQQRFGHVWELVGCISSHPNLNVVLKTHFFVKSHYHWIIVSTIIYLVFQPSIFRWEGEAWRWETPSQDGRSATTAPSTKCSSAAVHQCILAGDLVPGWLDSQKP